MDGMGYQTHASNQLHDYQTTTETTSTFNKKKAIDKPWPKVAGMSDSGTAVFSVWWAMLNFGGVHTQCMYWCIYCTYIYIYILDLVF